MKTLFTAILATLLVTLAAPAAQAASPKLLKVEFVEVKDGSMVYKATYDTDLKPGDTDPATDLLKTTLKSARTLNGSSGASVSGKTAVLRIGLDPKAEVVKDAPVLQKLKFISSVGTKTVVYEASFNPAVPAKSAVPDAVAKAVAMMDAVQRGHANIEKDEKITLKTTGELQSDQTTLNITLRYSGGIYNNTK